MRFSVAVKEKIARIIAEHFTTNAIANVFADTGITVDTALYAKWRITLDAFGKMLEPEVAIPHIIEALCHPLNFDDPQARKSFIKKLNAVLTYENFEIKATDRGVSILDDGFPTGQNVSKTPTDYVVEAIKFFKDEYNKVRISGLKYEYFLDEVYAEGNTRGYSDEYKHRLKAIKRLKEAGLIQEYTLGWQSNDDGTWEFAICKIDESQITQKEAPRATDAGVHELTQKIIHEHTHHFENSVQEKGIDLNHKFEGGKTEGLYITKDGDDFSYKGRYINLSKKSDYYKVFCALYAKLPNGGEVPYKKFIAEVKSRLPKTQNKTDEEMRKFIQRNLTDKHNGFMRYAGIPDTEDNGKSLIEVVRGSGVLFNNKVG